MKKIFSLLILLIWAFILKGQVISIPDVNFKNALLTKNCVDLNGDSSPDRDADLNNDGEIDIEEALAINRILFFDLGIASLEGIEYFTNLIDLNVDNNNLTSLNLSNLLQLSYLSCNNNQISKIKLANLKNVWDVECNNNKIEEIFLDTPTLLVLSCNNNQLKSLDISHLKNLYALNCNQNDLRTLNIKNKDFYTLQFDKNPNLNYICCVYSRIAAVSNLAKSYGLIDCEVNSYCSFTPGGNFNTIKGETRFDFDLDGCSLNDIYYSSIKYNIIKGIKKETVINNFSNAYLLRLQGGQYVIKPEVDFSEAYIVSPDSITFTFSATSDTILQDFCITPKYKIRAMDITIVPITSSRPGFDSKYKLIMTNKGTQLENGVLNFTYDESKMNFVSADVSPYYQSDGLIAWDFLNLYPFETKCYYVTLKVNSPNEILPVNIGDELLFKCNILDNVFTLRQTVVGSFDPNDKTCLEGNKLDVSEIGKYLYYLIRFENTGNYAAENIVVKDVIDDSKFDISSLQIIDASHEALARINANEVEFIFEKINLPFSNDKNDGYIAFKIKSKSNLVLGDELKNSANIYFDYNKPILTNTTTTLISQTVKTFDNYSATNIDVFPNPAHDVLKFNSGDEVLKAEIYDLDGRLIQASGSLKNEINVANLMNGTYNIILYTESRKEIKRFVKI